MRGFLRCSDSEIDIAGVAIRDLGIRLPGGRLDVIEVLPPDGLDEFAVDEISDANQGLSHNNLRAETSRDSATSLGMTRRVIASMNSPLMKFRICRYSILIVAGHLLIIEYN